MKKSIFIFFILFSFSNIFIGKVSALQIKNVNYSANNNNDRWIEIFNDGSDILDFTTGDYKVLDSKDTTKHSIVNLQGDNTFPSNTSIFISPSTSTPSGATKAFRSSYSLDKTNGYVSIINSDNTYTYFCFAYGNISCSQSSPVDTSTSTNATSTQATSTQIILENTNNIVYVYIPTNNQNKYGDISVLLPEEKIIPAGGDYEFTVKAVDQFKKAISGLDFEWSFGDGGEKFGQKVSHHYTYPGDYLLIASADGYSVGGEAKMNVKVISPDVIISKVGINSKENFIDLENDTDYDLILSNFYLNIDKVFYKLPKNFTIAKRKTVHISGEALGFNLPALEVSLNYPNKNLLVSYINKINLSSATSAIIDNTSSIDTKLESNNKLSTTYLERKTNIKSNSNSINNENLNNSLALNQTQVENQDYKDDSKYGNQENVNKLKNQKLEYFNLKRLVFKNEEKESEINGSEEVFLNKEDNVDIGIVNWFKSLLY